MVFYWVLKLPAAGGETPWPALEALATRHTTLLPLARCSGRLVGDDDLSILHREPGYIPSNVCLSSAPTFHTQADQLEGSRRDALRCCRPS